MRPVAIFRHSRTEGPGYFAIFLEAHGVPWQLVAIDEDAAIPSDPQEFSGLCFMGGPMSVNDPLPWIEEVCTLIRRAVEADVPVIGHCLGGQLMSKALGGTVSRNPVKEIGWGGVSASDNPAATHWLGEQREAVVFHWHGETFSLPAGADSLMSSACCAQQAFALGLHLGMQCHIEMLPEMIRSWSKGWNEEITNLALVPPSVQSPEHMLAQIPEHLPGMRRLADQLYAVWIRGLRR